MSALVSSDRPEAPLFSDGIGDRVVSTDPTTGELVQVMRLNPSLTAVPSFEFALRERVARLANFRHLYFARVRRVDRAPSHPTALSLVSDHVEGTRLSEILRVADERGLYLDINAAMCLIRQLVPAMALLHENARDAAHGLVALERLVVTPQGRLVIAEHVCGAAVEQMQYGRERLWHEFRVAMPPSAGIPRFDQRADVTGIGVVALSLVLGRPLRDDEFPRRVGDLLNEARERTALGDEQPLSPALRSWLARALQVDVRRAFASAPEALAALDELSADGSVYIAAPIALETFLSRYISALLVTPAPAVPAEPVDASFATPALSPAVQVQPPEVTELLSEPLPGELLEPVSDVKTTDGDQAVLEPHVSLPPGGTRGARNWRRWLAVASLLIVLASVGLAAFRTLAGSSAPTLATLTVESNPSGVPVFIDGVERGLTPTRVTLAPGAHILELRRGVPRVIPLTLTAGAEVSQYLEFAEAPIPDLAEVEAETPITPPPTPAAPLAGWIAAKLPFVVEIHEKGRLLGTTESDRIMIAAGAHELEIVNATLGYREKRSVQIAPGRLTNLNLQLPHGVVNLNASPWAEVYLDGERIGETPIGNLSVPIGPHEIVFRHPQLGEKRYAISVTTGVPVRVSVEMKQ